MSLVKYFKYSLDVIVFEIQIIKIQNNNIIYQSSNI